MAKRDYYEVLGIAKGAGADEIKAAYRTRAIKHHPDKNQGDKQSEEKFKELNEAYSVLSDPEKRKLYDQYGHAGVEGAAAGAGGFQGFEGFSGFGDVFSDFFEQAFGGGGGGGRRTRGGGQAGRDLRVDKEVSLTEVLNGVDVTLDVQTYQSCDTCGGSGAKSGTNLKQCPDCAGRGQVRISHGFFTMAQTCPRCRGYGEIVEHPCATCGGSGRINRPRKVKVRIPPGVEDGTTLRISGAGEAGERGAPPGDLYVVVRTREDSRFEREGANLYVNLDVSFPLAALGGEVQVASLDGPVRVKIPGGTQSGVLFRVSGHGLPHLKSRSRGDLFVKVQVTVPKKLSKEDRKILQDLGSKWGDTNISKDESVFKKVFGS